MAVAIAVAPETAGEAAEQDYDQDNDEYRSKRHGTLSGRPAGVPQNADRGPDQSTFRAASPWSIRLLPRGEGKEITSCSRRSAAPSTALRRARREGYR